MVIQDYRGQETCLDGKILVFDLDGVLADSVEKKLNAWNDILPNLDNVKRAKLEKVQRDFSNLSRSKKIRVINEYLYAGSLSTSLQDRLLNQYSTRVVGLYQKCDWIKGAKKFIEAQQGPKYILSAAPEYEASFFFDRTGKGLFSNCFFDIEDKATKLREICHTNGVTPSQIVFFGDKKSDLNAGKIVGTQFIAINWNSSITEVQRYHRNFHDAQKFT